jgi:hypothetical protein
MPDDFVRSHLLRPVRANVIRLRMSWATSQTLFSLSLRFDSLSLSLSQRRTRIDFILFYFFSFILKIMTTHRQNCAICIQYIYIYPCFNPHPPPDYAPLPGKQASKQASTQERKKERKKDASPRLWDHNGFEHSACLLALFFLYLNTKNSRAFFFFFFFSYVIAVAHSLTHSLSTAFDSMA